MPPRAKPGEGIVLVLDVGPGVCAGTDTTFFSQAKDCVMCILQRKIFADKCRDCVGLVLFGTSGTDNQLATNSQYQHITVMQETKLVDWDLFNRVEALSGGSSSGDWVDALVVAMDLLHDPDGLRYSGKKIVLLTDFSGEFSDDQANTIVAGLLEQGIDLVAIGPDVLKSFTEDDEDTDNPDPDRPGPSNGMGNGAGQQPSLNWNGKPKTMVQLAGEAVVAKMVAKVDGTLCSFDDALPQLMFFEKRTQGSAPWNTTLDIGPDFKIPITGRIKVKHATPPTWKKSYARDPSAVITGEVSFHLYDEKLTVVDEEEVIPGYKYGSTLVPFSEEDLKMKYQSNSPRSLTVLGFTEASRVPHRLRAGDQVLVVTARQGDEAAAVALSAMIQSLVEMEMVCITRRVYNKNSNPVLGALFPDITREYECLIWIQLPFNQDVRSLVFPSLQGKMDKLKDEEKEAMDNLITAMALSHTPEGEDGAAAEEEEEEEEEGELDPNNTLNPQLQQYYSVLAHRAIHPTSPLPAPAQHVLSILEPPESVCGARDQAASSLKALFPTKKVAWAPKRTKENMFDVNEEEDNKKKAKLDDSSLSASDLIRPQVTKVTTATPVEDFMALLRGDAPNFNLICSQLGDVVLQLVNSLPGASTVVGAAATTKVTNCLTTFRQESASIDPATYNKFISRLKDTVASLALPELWASVKDGGLGLITSEENGRSTVGEEEANTFLQMDQEAAEAPAPAQEAGDEMEDLLDDL